MHMFMSNEPRKAVIISDGTRCLYDDEQRDTLFPSASLIKLPIMLYVYEHLYDALDQKLALDSPVEGSGPSPYLSHQYYTIHDLVTLMIIASDNTATNTIIEYIGLDTLNHYFMENHWSATILNRKMMDIERRLAGFDNMTSAADMMAIVTAIYRHQHFEDMFTMMKRQQLKEKIRLYIVDSNIETGSKSGEFDQTRHEVGIMRYDSNILLFACLTDHPDPIKTHQAFHSFGLVLKDIVTGNQSPDFLQHNASRNTRK